MVSKAPCTTPTNWNKFTLSLNCVIDERNEKEYIFGLGRVLCFFFFFFLPNEILTLIKSAQEDERKTKKRLNSNCFKFKGWGIYTSHKW